MAGTKHGITAYKDHNCRCKICKQAYQTHLTRRAKARKDTRPLSKRLPSVTNTCSDDTMTKGQYDRWRNSA